MNVHAKRKQKNGETRRAKDNNKPKANNTDKSFVRSETHYILDICI